MLLNLTLSAMFIDKYQNIDMKNTLISTIIRWVVSDESYMIMSSNLSSEQTVFPPLIVIIVLLVIMLSKHSYYRSATIILSSDS